MKNLFFVSVAFSIFSGTSLSATAQNSVRFINNIEFTHDTEAPVFTTSTPVKKAEKSALLTSSAATPVETEKCSALQFKYAQILNKEVEAIINLPLYEFIDDWYGTRYRYGGTTKKGVDCSSLTSQLMEQVYDITIPRTARLQYDACERIQEEEMAEGDLVFFNTTGGVSHVGIFLGEGNFVHASSSSGVTISNLDEAYFKNRFIGAGRITVNKLPADNIAKVIL